MNGKSAITFGDFTFAYPAFPYLMYGLGYTSVPDLSTKQYLKTTLEKKLCFLFNFGCFCSAPINAWRTAKTPTLAATWTIISS